MLGAAVLIIAIIALREPKGHVSGASATRTVVRTTTPAATATPSTEAPSTGARSTGGPASTKGRSSSSSSSSSSPVGDPKSVPLVVLNTTTIPMLAANAAQRFESGGWTVRSFDNYQNNFISTCAYYDPSVPGSKAAAEALQRQYPTIKRVRERFAELPAGPVVVALTSDYSPG